MAASIRKPALYSLSKYLQISRLYNQHTGKSLCRFCTSVSEVGQDISDPGPIFIRPDVQAILRKVTGTDVDVIFQEKPTVGAHPPKYRLLTNKQLKEVQEEVSQKTEDKLQMPPVLKARDRTAAILSEDPEIEAFDTDSYVFTDVTYGLPDGKRTVVVRETNGTLRHASSEERDRVLQVYYPQPGRTLHTPALFEEENLEVCQRTYEHIASNNAFHKLRYSRHFGGMAFYTARYNRMEGLLTDMLQRGLLSDADDMIQLFSILHPESKTTKNILSSMSPLEKIKIYLDQDARNPASVELALQSLQQDV